MRVRSFFVSICVLLGLSSAWGRDPNPVPTLPKDDAAMQAAFAKARAGFDGFLALLAHPPRGAANFAVKIGLVDAPGGGCSIVRPGQDYVGRAEFFWVSNLSRSNDGFSGQISNDPESVHCARLGDPLRFVREDVADWTYVQDGKIKGNATACPALAHASEQERRRMALDYGLLCD